MEPAGLVKDMAYVDNAASEKQVKNAERKVRSIEVKASDDLRAVLSSPNGRRFIWRLLKDCKIYEESFTGNSTTFYNEGRRSVGLKILDSVMKADVDMYLKMQLEHKGEVENG